MGGTDQMDANLNVYRIGIRGKKWWWPIFTWLVDVCVQNAWIIYKNLHPDISQLVFRREITQVYLKKFQNLPKSSGRPLHIQRIVGCHTTYGMTEPIISLNTYQIKKEDVVLGTIPQQVL